jgi:osmotically-inducible protein OsmY
MRAFMKFSSIAALALLCADGCTLTNHGNADGQQVDDSTLSARAKTALIKDENVRSSDYSIEVSEGHVILTGVARTPTEAKLAADDIRSVDGVKSVKNDVRVANADAAVSK